MKKIFALVFVCALLIIPTASYARRQNPSDWYIEHFTSTIDLHPDSTATITEEILADAGNLPDKHGIFRILPTSINIDGTKIKTPVELLSISDFSGILHPYNLLKGNNTVTWKIGSANRTVIGENQYKIIYKVANVVRTDNPNFDEFFWNLNGNFWDIETDAFTATINFPIGVSKNTSEVHLYGGLYGNNTPQIASYKWIDEDSILVTTKRPLEIREGITISVTTPKHIFTPYIIHETLFEKYGGNLWWFLPLLTFIICFALWKKHGNDPNLHKPIIPEYEAPENLRPIELGMIMQNGKIEGKSIFLDQKYKLITATIIDLAIRNIITIKTDRARQYKLFKNENINNNECSNIELKFLEMIFRKKTEFSISSKSNDLNKKIKKIQIIALHELNQRGIFESKGFIFQRIMIAVSFIIFFGVLFSAVFLAENLFTFATFFGGASSALIIFIFALIMSKKTKYGAELEWKGKGFKYFMDTAEKYRQQFFEKEGMFEELLPYAIMFGMTNKWIKTMKNIYGEEYVNDYHPVWFHTPLGTSSSLDAFSSQLYSLSTAISTSVSPQSGSSGRGFSGGGGGGGGGGGW